MNIFTALTVLFVALKLCGVIAWSWLLVLSPAIIEIVLTAIILIFAFAVAVFAK